MPPGAPVAAVALASFMAADIMLTAATPPGSSAYVPVWIALIGVVPAAIAAWVSVKNGVKADATGKKADAILVKSEQIHVATNGHLSKLTTELGTANAAIGIANARIEGLEKLVASMVTGRDSVAGPAKDVASATENLSQPSPASSPGSPYAS